jgi:hypothetical protein
MIVLRPGSQAACEEFQKRLQPMREHEVGEIPPISLTGENLNLLTDLVELDGATIVDPNSGEVVQFAQQILVENGSGTSTTGTKHRAAHYIVVRFKGEGVIALPISQDGPITLKYFDSSNGTTSLRSTF